MTDDEIKKINNVDIVFEDIEFEKSPLRDSILLTIKAKTYPRANWYEEGNIEIGEIYISGTNTIHRVFYRIEISRDIFYKGFYDGNFEEILKIVKSSLPPAYEKCQYEIYRKIVEKLYEGDRNKLWI